MPYIVKAPLVVAKTAAGYVHIYEGAPLPENVDDEQLEQLKAAKMVTEGSSRTVDGAPPKNASKEEWVDFAVANGADPDEAGNLSKNDLIAQYGSQ